MIKNTIKTPKDLKLFFILIFLSQFSFSQLPSFVLNVTSSNETCTANATLNFNVSGTVAGSTVAYSVYRLPDLITPIAVTTTNFLGSLTAGNFRVRAIQTSGTLTNMEEQDVVINNLTIPLQYSLIGQNAVCGNDGSITVNLTTGTFVSCEIISGTATRPSQTSNVLTGLSAGVYTVRVFDSCGEGVVQTFSLGTDIAGINNGTPNLVVNSCTEATLSVRLFLISPVIFAFPLNVVFTINPPSGQPLIYNQTITASSLVGLGIDVSQLIPLYSQGATYSINIQDRCGNIKIINGTASSSLSTANYEVENVSCLIKNLKISGVTSVNLVIAPLAFPVTPPFDYTPQIINNTIDFNTIQAGNYIFNVVDLCGTASVLNINISTQTTTTPPEYAILNSTCLSSDLNFNYVKTAVLISAPATYTLPLPNNYTSSIINNQLDLSGLPNGTYVFMITDLCDVPSTLTIVLSAPSSNPPVVSVLEGCDIGKGSIAIFGDFQTIIISAAPNSFPFNLPYDATAAIQNGFYTLLNVFSGTYTFQVTDICNAVFTVSGTVQGYRIFSSIANIIPNCGSFNIDLRNVTNNQSGNYWLQRLNPVTNLWEHPATGVVYNPANPITNNTAIALNNNAINLNFGFTGTFRIINSFIATVDVCQILVKQFVFDGLPKINQVYSFACTNNKFDVIVDAGGAMPLIYRITTKNGIPFVLQNANSSIFLGLDPALYNFQVEDSCGNIVNSQFAIPRPLLFNLTASQFCPGQIGILSVPNFPFLQYQWWKDNNTTFILSTNANLQFNNFNPVTNAGVYHVRVRYVGNPNSCINFILDYTIPINLNVPNAGQNNTVNYCDNQGNINLFNLISGTYDTGGTWTELTNSGVPIANNSWNSTSVNIGNYRFKYKITNSCGVTAESIIQINFRQKPNQPIVTANNLYCTGEDIQFGVNATTGATYSWTGPNGFISSIQNPLILNSTTINSGVYVVTVTLNGCSLSSNKTVNVSSTIAPNAGQDSTVTYCTNPENINLLSLISGTYDLGGTWTEISNSGVLIINNSWNATALTGNFQFKYKVENTCATFDESIVSIIIKTNPNIPVATANNFYCVGETIQLGVNSTIGATYSWSGPNGFVSNIQNPAITNAIVLNSGVYSVTVSLNGCLLTSNKSLTVNEIIAPKAGQDNSVSYCGNQGNINLSSLISGVYDLGGTWSEISSSGVPITNNFWNATTIISGSYQFKYTVLSACNSSDESIINIQIKPIPVAATITVNANLCATQSIDFNVNQIVGASYSWSGPNGFVSNIHNPSIANCTVANSGNYQLVVSQNGCSSNSNINITVKPQLDFEIITACIEGKFKIYPKPILNSYDPTTAVFNWINPKNDTINNEVLTLSGSDAIGEYELTIINSDGCQTSKKINVASTSCSIPLGFSPNNDGFNDSFDISGLGKNINLAIFNRYGMKIYEQNNYSNQWYGQDLNGNILPDATYFYLIKLEDSSSKTGWVYLSKEIK